MNYEDLIFGTATACVQPLMVYFVVIMILDYVRTMAFGK